MVDPRIRDVADDNRVPDLTAQWPLVLRGMLRHGLAWLAGDRPPGAALLSRPAPSPLRTWAPIILALAAIAAGSFAAAALALGGALAWIVAAVGVVALVFAAIALLMASAIAHVLPPPPRPECQLPSLPHRPGEPHPLQPYFRATDLVEYVPGEVWVAQMPLRFLGGQLGARMVVVRGDREGHLLIHSPIAPTPAILDQVRALGEVRWIVAPNLLHHLFVGPWLEAFPAARAYAAPGLPERRPDLPWAGVLASSDDDVPWDRSFVDHVTLRGHPFHVEVALYHRPSRTLLLCDQIENLGHAPETASALVRWGLELAGMARRPTAPTDLKLSLDDPEATRAGVRAVLAWPFERVIIAHGRLIERDARATMIDAFAHVLRPGDV
ncbi:MAG: DUF4336 domain-containing protein [Myxococcales bacterium]|nr:DUF4336 domain-containing protein [Myxococcales bacterium]